MGHPYHSPSQKEKKKKKYRYGQSQVQVQVYFYNVVSASSREADSDIISYPESKDDEEEIVFSGQIETPMIAVTRSGNLYHKQYEEASNPSQPSPLKMIKQPAKPLAKLATDKQKEKDLRHTQPLNKDKVGGTHQPFCFNVLAQLANIPARITLYELLKLFADTWEALREAMADAKVIAAFVEATQVQGESESLQISKTAYI